MTSSHQADQAAQAPQPMPAWLMQSQQYTPPSDRDGFITQSVLSVSSVLARFRLDDGTSAAFSPSAPVKLVFGLACILMTSLSRNWLFVVAMLAGVLLRACLLPTKALSRTMATAASAAVLTLLIMAPAALLGQPRSAVTMATKAFVSTALVMEVTLTTLAAHLTGALRAFGVPSLVIMTLDLALRSIVRLGEVALETLDALRLRSVGRNRNKQGSLGGVAGVVLIKAGEAARQTHDAMRCRGFEGTYEDERTWKPSAKDFVWLIVLALIMFLFVYLQRQV